MEPVAAAGAVAPPAGMFSVCVPASAVVAAAGAITKEGAAFVTAAWVVDAGAAAGEAALSTGTEPAMGGTTAGAS